MLQREAVRDSKKFQNYYLKCMILAVLTILILFGTFNKIFSLMAFAICSYLIVFDDDHFSLMMMIYLLMFAGIFKLSYDGMSYYTFLVLAYVIMTSFKKQEIPGIVVVFAVYVVGIQCLTQSISVEKDIKLIGNLFFLYYAFLETEECDESVLQISYIVGVIVSSFFRFLDSNIFRITLYVGALKNSGSSSTGNDLIRFSGLFFDPNYYAINVMIALILVVVLYYKKKINTIGVACLSFPLLYFAVLTKSKSALLMLLFPITLLVYTNRKAQRYWIQFFCVAGAALFLILFLSGKIHILDDVISRFTSKGNDLDSLTTGRFHLWTGYLQYMVGHPGVLIWGRGIGAEIYSGKGVHNTYIEMLYHLGIVGSSLFFSAIYNIYQTRYRRRKRNYLNISILLCIFLMYMFLGMLGNFEWPVHLLFGFMTYRMDCNEKGG